MTLYSDQCYDSNEFIVRANTKGIGHLDPLERFTEKPNKFLFHAGAYWREQKRLEKEGHDSPYLGAANYMRTIGFTQDDLNDTEFHEALQLTNPNINEEA